MASPILNSALGLVLTLSAPAAVITWGWSEYVNSGVDLAVMGIDQIDQSGDKFLAVNLGDEGAQTLVQSVDPDIAFTSSDPNFSVLGGMSLSSPAGSFHDDLGGNNNISGSAAHADYLGGEIGPASFRLSNLVIGRTYNIQTLLMNFNAFGTDVYMDGIPNGGFGEQQAGGTNGHLGSGTFTADASTQDFTILTRDIFNNPQGGLLNAIYVQSRPVPEPSTALLACLALACASARRHRQLPGTAAKGV
jgi:hypothetical protein